MIEALEVLMVKLNKIYRFLVNFLTFFAVTITVKYSEIHEKPQILTPEPKKPRLLC